MHNLVREMSSIFNDDEASLNKELCLPSPSWSSWDLDSSPDLPALDSHSTFPRGKKVKKKIIIIKKKKKKKEKKKENLGESHEVQFFLFQNEKSVHNNIVF